MNRILLIDDNIDTLIDIADIFKQDKHDTFIITDNFDAINLEKITDIGPNIVLIDIELKGEGDKTGLRIANMIKSGLKDVSVIIVAFYNEEDIVEAFKYDLFISKPCSAKSIYKKVQPFLK